MTYIEVVPATFADFFGQEHVIEDLKVHVKAAIDGGRAMEHVLFYGPPGLGKSTLARIIAKELGVKIIEKGATAYNSLFDLENDIYQVRGGVLFIDEILRLPKKIAEALYTPLESYVFNEIPMKPFTLIGATNYAGDLDRPMRDRITHKYEFSEYSVHQIAEILGRRGAPHDVAHEIAKRSRNTPRIARDFLRKIDNQRNFDGDINLAIKHCEKLFKRQEIDELGLTRTDVLILKYLLENGAGSASRAIGERALCTVLNIDVSDYRNMIEPHLLRTGFLRRTSRGRIITRDGIDYATKLF